MAESLIDRIKRHEGLRLAPYRDSRGNWTIGYGHKMPGIPLTEEQADQFLLDDLNHAGKNVQAALPWIVRVNGVRGGVLIEMAFQLGLDGLLEFKRMLMACEAGAYGVAADEMLISKWHDETPARCEELAQIMRKGDST